MKTLLSLDLGLSTGWAVLVPQSSLSAHGVITPEDDFERWLKGLLLRFMPTHSVAERPVVFRGALGDALEERIRITDRVLDHQVKYVYSSGWKGSKYKKHPVPKGISQHERDAIRIGVWYWDTYLKDL